MTLYIIMLGERGEGGRIRGIKTDPCDAVAFALSLETCSGHPWVESQERPMFWQDGCDLLWIEEWECSDEYPTGFHYSGPGERSCHPVSTVLALLPVSESETGEATQSPPERRIM